MTGALKTAKRVIDIEIAALAAVSEKLDEQFIHAIELIFKTKGRVIICGMGKSGIIGKKIAASLASTGTPSFFMHPGEAFHGDLGMVTKDDLFLAISNSGETEEVIKLIPFLKDNKNTIIALTGKPESTLAKNSNCHINIGVPKEACPLQLAPTSSTTATLVIGDALTVALMEINKFQPESFARFHPGGNLGRRLVRSVESEMISENLPIVKEFTPMSEVINVMSKGSMGLAIVECDNKIKSVITDGDLRRAIERYSKDLFDMKASDIAVGYPVTVAPTMLMGEAFDLMELKKIKSLVVCERGKIVGILQK
ncbi:KpsF/GutQ family sugar-phosphate isomerase [Catenovulum sp. SX2]|uniref:KpsF/GutQ family sugar-phosphate isomerase n=1 Tax=Catenovulum sp. SX2 TaxID=3398614 RepID=UPI003F82B16E